MVKAARVLSRDNDENFLCHSHSSSGEVTGGGHLKSLEGQNPEVL